MNDSKLKYIKLYSIQVLIFLSFNCFGQCPSNIGFEKGNFDNWICSVGIIARANGSISVSPSIPLNGRHTMRQNSFPQLLDQFGLFPVNCPNGSGFSIQLGNATTGAQAERVSYTFIIPPDQINYSIIYNYAVVFQNPTHAEWEQPKFTANVFDETNGTYIGCSSFSYAASSNLPGFHESSVKDSVFFKTWTPVTIKLTGYEGRTIRLEFTTNDCSRGGHFGYAYVDVNENCTSPISGYTYCLTDLSQTLTAPFGFSEYRWFNNDFSRILGNEINLTLNPPSPPNTVFAVEVTPFPEQGCIDTVYATIKFSGDLMNLKVPTTPILACVTTGADITSKLITAGSSPINIFAYYSDPSQLNYLPTPKNVIVSGTYFIKATNSAGCTALKPVTVKILGLPVYYITDPLPIPRPSIIDLNSTISSNSSGIAYSFWRDSLATLALSLPKAINKSGVYFIKGTNEGGCFVTTRVTVQVVEPTIVPPNAFTPNGDGVHDTWEIPLLSLYPDCVVEIFNRLGQQLYRSLGYTKPWDGKYMGVDVVVATYYYVIKLPLGLKPIGGGVTVVR